MAAATTHSGPAAEQLVESPRRRGRDHGRAARERFQHNVWETFVARQQHKCIRFGNPGIRVLLESGKVHAFLQACFRTVARSSPSSGPSPRITTWTRASGSSATASISRSNPFWCSSRPAATRTGPPARTRDGRRARRAIANLFHVHRIVDDHRAMGWKAEGPRQVIVHVLRLADHEIVLAVEVTVEKGPQPREADRSQDFAHNARFARNGADAARKERAHDRKGEVQMAQRRQNDVRPPLPDQLDDRRQGVKDAGGLQVYQFHVGRNVGAEGGTPKVDDGQRRLEPAAIQVREQSHDDPLGAAPGERGDEEQNFAHRPPIVRQLRRRRAPAGRPDSRPSRRHATDPARRGCGRPPAPLRAAAAPSPGNRGSGTAATQCR